MLRTSLDEEIAVEIERPSEEVWAFVTNFERLPEWLDEFEAVVKESDGPMSRGTVFRYTLSPGSRSATLEVVDWQPGRRLAGPRSRTTPGDVYLDGDVRYVEQPADRIGYCDGDDYRVEFRAMHDADRHR